MHTAVASGLLSKQHRFDPLKACPAALHEVLDSSAFMSNGQASVPTGSFVSTSSASPFFSPSAEKTGIAWADKAVIRKALDRSDPSLISQSWQGFWALCNHSLVFRIVRRGVVEYDWHVALHHYTDSAVVALPVALRSPPAHASSSEMDIEPLQTFPVAIAVTDMSEVTAFRIVWRSWTWQVQTFPGALGLWSPAVRGFRAGPPPPPEGVLRVCAKAGWWSLGRGILDKVAAHLGIEAQSDGEMFGLLWRLTQTVMGDLSDDAILDLLRHRQKHLSQRTNFSHELLSIDEAMTCLEESEQQELRRQQQEVKERQAERRSFRESYREREAAVRQSSATSSAAKKAAAKLPWKGPRQMPPLASLTHAVAKELMPPSPPKSWLWRAHTQGAWMSRVLDLPVCSRSDSSHGGGMNSLKLVLQDAWRQWLTVQGWAESACPIAGMFDVVDPRRSTPAGHSAPNPQVASSSGA